MEFTRDLPVKVRFTVADKITVRQQMAYLSDVTATNRPHIERLWLGAVSLIQEWECELFVKDVNLDEITDSRITDIMVWAALQVRTHVNSLDEVPKNL